MQQEAGTSEADVSTQRGAISERQSLTDNISDQHTPSDQRTNNVVISEELPISIEQPVLSGLKAATSVTYSVKPKPVTVPSLLPPRYEPHFNTDMSQNIAEHQLVPGSGTGPHAQTGQVVSEPNIVISAQNTLIPPQQPNTSVHQFITIKSEQDLLSPSQYALTSNTQHNTTGQLVFTPGLQIVKSEHHFVAPRQVLSPRQQPVGTAHGPQIVIHGQQMGSAGQQVLTGQHVIPYVHGQPATAGHVMISNHAAQFVTGHGMHNQNRSLNFGQQAAAGPGVVTPPPAPLGRPPASPIHSLVHMNRTNPITDVEYMYSQYLRMLNR